MTNIQTELDRLLGQLKKEVASDLFYHEKELAYLTYLLRNYTQGLVLHDIKNNKEVFVSSVIKGWLGYGGDAEQVWYTTAITNPDCEQQLGRYFVHFIKCATHDLCNVYHLTKSDGGLLLLYGCSRCICFDEGGHACLVITLLCPVDYLFGFCYVNEQVMHPLHSAEMCKLFNSLSPREKEILPLLLNDMTDEEIAAATFISAGTVKVHRNNIKQKLQLNTFCGMARYSVFF